MKAIRNIGLVAAVLLIVSFAGCDFGGGTVTPDYVGTWTQSDYFTIQLTSNMLTKLTYNETTRDTIFTGSRGPFTEADGVITWTWEDSWSSSVEWYSVTDQVKTYKWSVSGSVLTLTEVINDVDQTPVEWTKIP